MPQQLMGGFERTGVYLSHDDFDELKQVIARAQMKDALLKKGKVIQTGGAAGKLEVPTIGSITIQNFMKTIAKTYGFKDSDTVQYGVNNKREIMRWMTPKEITTFRNKKGG